MKLTVKKPTIEEKTKILEKVNDLVDGEVTMKKYKKLYFERDDLIPISRLMGNEKWTTVKDRALPEQALTMEKAIETAKEALEWSGKDYLTISDYEEYRKMVDGPSHSFIKNRMRWSTFKKNFTDSNFSTQKEIMEKDIEENFCWYCRYKEECAIEMETCKYWRYWNANKRKNCG